MHHRSTLLRRALASLAVAAGLVAGASACQPTPVVPVVTPPPAPTTAKATCPAGAPGTSITVAASIVADVRDLLAAAKADKVLLCGGGYRSPEGQIAVRKANCGPTTYDIWEKPASQCSPPTAKPGTSMHEKGLAIDFSACQTRTTACYLWLAKHAATFGLKNLPSEPWHWSTTGG